METNWYNLSRKWFDFCFENPDKINTNHTALFMFIIEQWNRFWQKEKFWFPALYSMEVLWIKSKTTYYKTFNDLMEFWFIEIIEKSKNQNTANIIAISKNKSAIISADNSALDTAMIQQVSQQREYNKTNKQTNQETNKSNLSKDKEQSSLVKIDNRRNDINQMQELIKNKILSLWLIYKSWTQERNRIQNILTAKDFWLICDKANMNKEDFVLNIIDLSTKIPFWKWKIYNAETLYKHYASVYNEAVRIKSERQKPRGC